VGVFPAVVADVLWLAGGVLPSQRRLTVDSGGRDITLPTQQWTLKFGIMKWLLLFRETEVHFNNEIPSRKASQRIMAAVRLTSFTDKAAITSKQR
jgi:hypothetical protein